MCPHISLVSYLCLTSLNKILQNLILLTFLSYVFKFVFDTGPDLFHISCLLLHRLFIYLPSFSSLSFNLAYEPSVTLTLALVWLLWGPLENMRGSSFVKEWRRVMLQIWLKLIRWLDMGLKALIKVMQLHTVKGTACRSQSLKVSLTVESQRCFISKISYQHSPIFFSSLSKMRW
jgi:hypothetical protein